MYSKTQRNTLFYLMSLSAILIAGMMVSVLLPTNVAAQGLKCKFGVLKVVKINGQIVEICIPPYIVFLEHFKFKPTPPPPPPPPPDCPVCGAIQLTIDPGILERLNLDGPLITIQEGKVTDNVTFQVPHNFDNFGNTTMGLKGSP